MRKIAWVVLALALPLAAQTAWVDSSLVDESTINAWCRHCPDLNQTSYSFKADDGTIYVGQTHTKLDITVNGKSKIRFENDGHVGDHLHVLDDAGKDHRLKIVQKRRA